MLFAHNHLQKRSADHIILLAYLITFDHIQMLSYAVAGMLIYTILYAILCMVCQICRYNRCYLFIIYRKFITVVASYGGKFITVVGD